MSTSDPNNSAPPSPDDPGVAGDVLSPASLLAPRCTLLVQGLIGSFNSQVHSEQPHVQGAPPICVCPASATELNGPGELVLLANAGNNAASITTAQRHTDTLESFILSPPQKESGAARRVGLHQAILLNVFNAAKNIEEQARVLIRLAELAYGARDYAALNELSHALFTIPFRPAQNAAIYYRAVLFKRAGQLDQAAAMLADLHQPRAVLTLAAICENKGEWTEAARLHVEVMRRAKEADTFSFVCAAMQIAMIKAIEGNHTAALAGFESLWPIVRAIAKTQPHVYPAWCNALAAELTELGRIEEAQAASVVAVTSPFSHAYPEWQETAAEIAAQQPTRTIVAVALPQIEMDALEERPRLLIQHCVSSPRRLPVAPPSPTTARLLTSAPIRAPTFRL